MNFSNFFKNKTRCSRAFVDNRMKFVFIGFAIVSVFIFLIFAVQRYFNSQSELIVNTSQKAQDEFIKTLDQKLSVTQAEIKEYIDRKFEKSNKELSPLKEIDKKLTANQGEIKEYMDQKFEKNNKELSPLKEIDKKMTENQGEIKEYIKCF